MKKIYTFTVLLCCLISKTFAQQPSAGAATPPARNSTDVVSIYSNSYTNVAGTDFFPNWGQTTTIAEFIVGADTMIKYSNFNYEGIQMANSIDVSNMTKLHFDLWTSNCTAFDVFLINTSPAPTVEQPITVTPTLNGWNSFDIDLSLYTNIALHNVSQIKLVSTPFGGPTVFLDNIYFYKSSNTPTITNFTIPAKSNGASPFTITAPSSNSSGAFTYTSSNTAVATVSGNTITVKSVGFTTIKATQAASGSYTAGSISTTFFVNTGLPSTPQTAAPVPTKAQANVISLYSNSYQNKTVDTWSAVWDQADIADTVIAGNDTKKYTNLVYSGIEFTTNTINVTNADFFHVDIWTPNATSFAIKLVDFGANGTYGGGDDVEFQYTATTPAYSTWVSYDIPMSAFPGLTTKAHLAQMLFVSSGSTVYFDNVFFWANTAVLPVSITSFTANKKDAVVLLNWNTSNEANNAGFNIERSNDGKIFESLGFVSSNLSNNYSFVDAHPINGVGYYRLKQIDINGKFVYSSIIMLNTKVKNLNLTFYPNPVKNNLFISIAKVETYTASISLIDMTGKLLRTQLLKNNNSNTSVTMDISNLNKGTYFLVLTDGNNTTTNKVVVE